MALERDIVIFGLAEWDSPLPTNQHHLARNWARSGRVLFVDTVGTRRARLSVRDVRRIAQRLRKGRQGPRPVAPSLWRISPLGPPPGLAGARRDWLAGSFARAVGAAIRALDFQRPIAWFYNPRAAKIILEDQAKAFHQGGGGVFSSIVFHAVDDLANITGAAAEEIESGETLLVEKAGLLLASAPPLFDKLNVRAADRAHFLPNVADIPHFHQAAAAGASVAPAIDTLPRPRILFSGNLVPYKIDVELLRAMIEARPGWQWIFIGPVWEGGGGGAFAPLRASLNAHFLGRVDYAALPAHLAGAGALIIPYRRDAAAESVSPLKFFEYLATGKPVVATSLPALRPYPEIARLADTPEDFIQALEDALAESDPAAREARIALARKFSWERRMMDIDGLLESVDAR